MAGLAAAQQLNSFGFEVIVLESRVCIWHSKDNLLTFLNLVKVSKYNAGIMYIYIFFL